MKHMAAGYILFIVLFLAEVAFAAFHFESIAALAPWQLALIGLAAFRGGRAISFNGVFAWLRAPFTKLVADSSGAGDSVEPSCSNGPFLFAVADCLCCPICTATHVGGILFDLIVIFPPFGLALAYFLAVAGIAELFHWHSEKDEWQGRQAREFSGTEWLRKNRDGNLPVRTYNIGDVMKPEIRKMMREVLADEVNR